MLQGLSSETMCIAVPKAIFSPCGLYRFTLHRRWSKGFTLLNFLMLNPSTATDDKPDPTVTRCIGFAKDLGYSGLIVTNLYAFRATDPKEMKTAESPIGADNDRYILEMAKLCKMTICAWGNHDRKRGRFVAQMLSSQGVNLAYLRLTNLGCPSHPLYLPANLLPTRWEI